MHTQNHESRTYLLPRLVLYYAPPAYRSDPHFLVDKAQPDFVSLHLRLNFLSTSHGCA